jgi:uncharacterized membrane protein YdjX (TVP38/TMEM64 family)
MTRRISPRTRFLALVTAVLGSFALVTGLGAPNPEGLAQFVGDIGMLGSMAAIATSALLLLALVPRSVLAAGAGLAFGPVLGTTYVLAGAALGALAAFAAGRWLGRDFVMMRSRLAAAEAWLASRGAVGVIVVRILPVAPFGLVSYAYGTTGISVRAYMIGTAVGAAPSTAIYATLGASALNPGSPAFAVSLAAAVALMVACATVAGMLRRRRGSANAGDTSLRRKWH